LTTEISLYIGGIFHLIWAIFDFFWPKFFNWKETLASLDDLQRIMLPLTSRMLTVLYLGVTYISFFHASELISTDLGRTFLLFIAMYWAVRAILQAHYIGFKKANKFNVNFSAFVSFLNLSNKTISYILFFEFWIISALYIFPLIFRAN
jgi:hypothetical protein